MSFSNIWLSEFVIIKLVSSAYRTGLDMSNNTFGKSLTYNKKAGDQVWILEELHL
jgi:hypothetical protein